ncbi:DctP family TRAP transporter solute-binding subunit [Alkalihalobacillus sp. TS-13]|uniref:DctP family TRAP transporter solute-binding subunit n=1 Tax=Alkalihalobacillus sp. TS-13 TaxID=2842455 RepID=UPI001C887AE3|nr:DctP family TRAP transporter solute-binding subunit [Alkalihalobacillus sp. TS-13]
MKTIIWVALLITIGIVTAVFVGFDFSTSAGSKEFDDEQNGLKDRITIKFSHIYSENSPQGQAARYFAKRLEERTDHQVEVEIYPNAVLYNEEEQLRALREGNVQMIAPSISELTAEYPRFQILDLPFVFTTHDLVKEAYDGKIGSRLLKDIEDEHMKGLDFWFGGYKQVTTDKKFVKYPSDFKRMHFGIMDSPIIKGQFNFLGASTSVVNFNRIYRDLEVNFIEGQENTVSNIYTRKLYQVQDYLTVSNHAIMSNIILINKDLLDELPPEIHEEMKEAMSETTSWISRHAIEINDRQIRQLKRDESIHIHLLTKDERKAWMEMLDPIYSKLEPILGKELVDEIDRIRNQ